MKKAIVIGIIMTLVVMLVAGFTMENVDSELISELEREGFEKVSQTLYVANIYEKELDGTVTCGTAYFDIAENHGVVTLWTREFDKDGNVEYTGTGYSEYYWSYEDQDFKPVSMVKFD